MDKLTVLKPFRLDGRWLAPGDPVPAVPGFDYEKAARKGFLEHEDGEAVENARAPSAADEHATGQQFEDGTIALLKQRDQLDADLTVEREKVKSREGQVDSLRAEVLQQSEARQAAEAEVVKLQEQVTELQTRPVPVALPNDALARINAVKGVGDTLAASIHAALLAPAEEPKPE
jgi:hypothetical protein